MSYELAGSPRDTLRHQGDGSGIRVAIVDSGVHASHPHVGGVDGGVAIDPVGACDPDYVDRLGHGTAVAAVIREKAPGARLFAVRIFDTRLSAGIVALVRAIDWAVARQMDLVNLSLGTTNPAHEPVLVDALHRAEAAGVRVVAARDHDGVSWLPGSLAHPAVVPVQVDWTCARERCRTATVEGRTVYLASGYPRPIPGVPPERNLSGISFAVANVTGMLAREQRSLEPQRIQ